METLSEFTLSQSINWLKDINFKLIERVELIESIIDKNKVEESDLERLKIINKHHYTSWEIIELPLDYDNLDLCLTIYNSTILDARNKYETFFDYQNDREFELHQYYLSKFISYNIEVDFFIQYFDNLSIQLTELSLTFSGCMHESEYGFCFNNVMNFANKEPDLMKRKQIYLDSFAAFNMYWIKSELCFPKETDEYKSQLEHFETYCFGCQKAIDTIDIQLQNIPISTKKDFRLIYENPIPNKNTTSPTNKLTNTIESTLKEKEKILSRYLENDIQGETDYTQTHINDFCNFLMGIGNAQLFIIDDSIAFTKIKIFDYIKTNTDNFNPVKFKYFIDDLRDFSNHITFYIKKNDNHTIEYDGVTGDCMEFLYNGIPAKSYHFSFNNDFTPEQVENSSFFNKVVFEKDSTLTERINLLKASIPNIHFPGTLTKLFQFSDIAEEEYKKLFVDFKVNMKNSKPSSKPKLQLIDFFKNKSNTTLMTQLQNEFQSYSGKGMAIVVYLLFTKYNLIDIIPNSKTQSRKHFVSLLKNLPDFDDMYAINKCFKTATDDIMVYENDALLIKINEKITQMINK